MRQRLQGAAPAVNVQVVRVRWRSSCASKWVTL
jgi:hypothetical protein